MKISSVLGDNEICPTKLLTLEVSAISGNLVQYTKFLKFARSMVDAHLMRIHQKKNIETRLRLFFGEKNSYFIKPP